MSLLAPISRDQLGDVGIPLARWWSHWRRHTRYIRRPTAHFRRELDDMGVDDTELDDSLGCNSFHQVWRSTLLGEEIIDFHPFPVYYEWYTQHYGIHMRLSDRVAGEEVPAYEHHYQVPTYEHQYQMLAYAQHFQDPAYAQQFQDLTYDQEQQQWPAYQAGTIYTGTTVVAGT
ncbi:hypothetical protein AHAS_Ahas03G0156800 [Arachis hypogaea]